MIRDPERLLRLIEEYGRMQDLSGYIPQSRGQRLNGLIAELLISWGIDAVPNTRSHGEIDVAFELNGRHFILEAKWEASRTDTGAIAKLQKRLRQRLGGTVGIFISMAGFTSEALAELTEGEQLMVLCFTKTYFEAMLSGFIPPEELIAKCVSKASRQGLGYVELEQLFDPPYVSDMAPEFGQPQEIEQLVPSAVPSFTATTLLSGLPFGQSGIAELTPTQLLLTTIEGIYLADLERRTIAIWLSIPNCSRNLLVDSEGAVYVVRKTGVGRLYQGRLTIAGGGLLGNVSLSFGYDGLVYAFSNGYPLPVSGRRNVPPQAVRLGNRLGSQVAWTLNYPAAEAGVAAYVDNYVFLVSGNAGISLIGPDSRQDLVPLGSTPANPFGLTRVSEDRFLIACNDVDLFEVNVITHQLKWIATFNLNGSVYELATSVIGGGYLSCHYSNRESQTRGIVIRWNYPIVEQE